MSSIRSWDVFALDRLKTPCLLTILLLGVTTASNAQHRSSGLDSTLRAKVILDAAVEAMGGVDALVKIKSIRRDYVNDWFGSGQSKSPFSLNSPTLETPSSNEHREGFNFVQYDPFGWLDRAKASDSTDFVMRISSATEKSAFDEIKYRAEKSFVRLVPVDELRSLKIRRLRRHPEGVIRMAMEHPEGLRWLGTTRELGRAHEVVAFADALGTQLSLYFDSETKLLTKTETYRDHPFAGDTTTEVIFADYRKVGPLRLPFHYVDRVAGVPTEQTRLSSIELNGSLPIGEFEPPPHDQSVRIEEDPPEPSVHQLADNLYLIRGTYNVVFAVFRDFVIVLEAPLNSQYSETCLALIRRTIPDRPIKYLVSTHFHFDHVAGIRPYVAQGIPIITTLDAKRVIDTVVAAQHRIRPDSLSDRPKPATIETVSGKRIIDDGSNRLELYDVGPTDHATQILVAYFPKERLLFEADLFDPVSRELSIASTDGASLAAKVRSLGLQVDRIVPVHGIMSSHSALQQGVAIRAKYVK